MRMTQHVYFRMQMVHTITSNVFKQTLTHVHAVLSTNNACTASSSIIHEGNKTEQTYVL
jgi:hypothetical protein